PRLENRYPFTLGGASGQPAPDGFVLWTRIAPCLRRRMDRDIACVVAVGSTDGPALKPGPHRRSIEYQGIIREMLGGQLLCARHHIEWIDLNRRNRRDSAGLRVGN